MPEPPDELGSEGTGTPEEPVNLDAWIDDLPEKIESVIPQLKEHVILGPDTHRTSDGAPEATEVRAWWGKTPVKVATGAVALGVAIALLVGVGNIGMGPRLDDLIDAPLDPSEKVFEASSLEETFDPIDDDTGAAVEQIELPPPFGCPPTFQNEKPGIIIETDDDTSKKGPNDTDSKVIVEGKKAGDPKCVKYEKNSHDFFVIVAGDGERFSKDDNTSYQVRFVVNNEWPVNVYYDDTGFEVSVGWNRQVELYGGVVRDQQGNRISNDSDVTVEWLDASTLKVVVNIDALDDVVVTEVRTEIVVYATDDNGVYLYDSFDIAIWKANP